MDGVRINNECHIIINNAFPVRRKGYVWWPQANRRCWMVAVSRTTTTCLLPAVAATTGGQFHTPHNGANSKLYELSRAAENKCL